MPQLLRVALALALLPVLAAAQILTSALTGTVRDPSGLGVAGAKLVLKNVRTGLARSLQTDNSGDFVLTGLEPGEYALNVSMEGFKSVEKTGITLTSGLRLPLGEIALLVGALSETITVTAEKGATVQTQSAERSGLVTSEQVENLLIAGRNPTALIQLLPGVVVTQTTSSLDRDTTFSVNGNRRTSNNITIDGIPTVDMDNGFSQKMNVNMDAVAEVQILLSNYQAEYGRNAGSNMNIVTKSGTRDFHGLGSYFKRHEQFNATNFFNNFVGVRNPRYRYNTWTYNVGGPVYIPNLFNRDKQKLFFFWSQEFWPISEGVTRRVTVPTELERRGDFSQSLDVNNRLIAVRDPDANAPFPNNTIPASRLNASGLAILRLFDTPNFLDRGISRGNYNNVFTSENSTPRRSDLLKIDYNINPVNQLYITYTGFNEVSEGEIGSTGNPGNWRQMRTFFRAPNRGVAARYTRVFTPSMINEFQFGFLNNPESGGAVTDEELARNTRDAVGFTIGQFNPSNNPFKIIPNATFGGVPSPANLNVNGRFPARNAYKLMNWTDKFSWIHGAHTLKAGLYLELARRDVNQAVAFNGAFDFGRNANNPLDTGYAYSNVALGVFNSYSEPSSRPRMFSRTRTLEWFAQDNWKVNRRLTLDYGLRLYWIPPIVDANDSISAFAPNSYDPAQRVRLIAPATVGGRRVGVSPVNGEVFAAPLIGAIAPGAGNPANGMVQPGVAGTPRALMRDRGIHYAPRFGFAFDPTGKGRTALRGGFGMFYNRLNMTNWLTMTAQPPLVQTPVINFGRLGTLLGSSGLLFPQNVLGFDQAGKVPAVMNFNLAVQHKLAYDTVVEVAYQGSLGRNLFWRRDANPIPLGANFLPANADPTQPRSPLPPPFLRPINGYNNIDIIEPASSSNYHAMQVTANRRFATGLQLGLAWTWSKSMDFNSGDTETVSPLVPVRVWNYGLSSFDRTHIVKINWLYELPFGKKWKGVPGLFVKGWQFSGITTFTSGGPLGIGATTVVPTDITGTSSQGYRPVVTGNPILPKSERTFYRNFDTDVFRLPALGTVGNAARTLVRGPGVNNWDIALFKTVRLRESIRVQFRAETYNTFNHTQFSNFDTTARFDAAGRQANSQFGQFTAARDARIIQFALRAYF